MKDLIARLEQATEGSRRLSDKVLLATGWKRHITTRKHHWCDPTGHGSWHYHNRPDVTCSLDAALTMLPEGWCWSMSIWGRGGGWAGVAPEGWREHETAEDVGGAEANGSTPALALCIAILKALETEYE